MDLNNNIHEAFSKSFNLPIQFISQDAITNAYFTYEKLEYMSKCIMEKVNNNVKPVVGIVCGSGLGQIANLIKDPIIIPYGDIPEFPRSTVHGHKGNLIFGKLSGVDVVCMQGRFHPYEGYSLALCTIPIKIFRIIGVKLVIITNAAGGLNRSFKVGDLMVIKDHMSYPLLSLHHPLVGPHDERFGPRFTPINNIYSKNLRDLLHECGRELNIDLHEGVYAAVGGPTYETVTDSRMMLQSGMDCVGMSTTHEAVVASHCGMKVLAFSIITDMVPLEFDAKEESNHDEIVKIANAKAKDAEQVVSQFLKKISESDNSILD